LSVVCVQHLQLTTDDFAEAHLLPVCTFWWQGRREFSVVLSTVSPYHDLLKTRDLDGEQTIIICCHHITRGIKTGYMLSGNISQISGRL